MGCIDVNKRWTEQNHDAAVKTLSLAGRADKFINESPEEAPEIVSNAYEVPKRDVVHMIKAAICL